MVMHAYECYMIVSVIIVLFEYGKEERERKQVLRQPDTSDQIHKYKKLNPNRSFKIKF